MIRYLCQAAAIAALAACPATANAQFAPGAPGLGDRFFPKDGNGGYEVSHYDLELNYRPASRVLKARTVITANATQDLSAFDLDYRGPRVRSVAVNGLPAAYDVGDRSC